MKRIFLALVVLLAACDSKPAEKPPAERSETQPNGVIVGGWTPSQIDGDARGVAIIAWTALNRPGTTLASVDGVETQVVAGVNYRLRLTLSDKSRWEVVMWKKLDGTMEMTAGKQLENAP